MPIKCLIYCRVSSQRQVDEGHGLDSQEASCRNYAKSKNYEVIKVFLEQGVSGGRYDRPAMTDLLRYLGEHTEERFAVVFDDIKRFARDTEVHFALKKAITKLGHHIESPTFKFEETPYGKFIETIFAANAELDRSLNNIVVKSRMKGRLEKGYWCFRSPPLGLSYVKDPIHGKILKPVEPYATVFRNAIELYDKGELNTLEEVQKYIGKQYLDHKVRKEPSISGIQGILTELLYTGYIEYEKWGIKRMKGLHEGFISVDTYNRVQNKLKCKSKTAIRKDYNLDFPLRTWVLCDTCNHPFTAAWVHGRSAKYPKYWCKNKQCLNAFKSVPRETIEIQFAALLTQNKPVDELLDLEQVILNEAWDSQEKIYFDNRVGIQKRLEDINKQSSDLARQAATKIAEGETGLAQVYEQELKKLVT